VLELVKQCSPAGVIAAYLSFNSQPTFHVESLCSSANMKLRLSFYLIMSRLHDVAAVIGFQKIYLREIHSCIAIELSNRLSLFAGFEFHMFMKKIGRLFY